MGYTPPWKYSGNILLYVADFNHEFPEPDLILDVVRAAGATVIEAKYPSRDWAFRYDHIFQAPHPYAYAELVRAHALNLEHWHDVRILYLEVADADDFLNRLRKATFVARRVVHVETVMEWERGTWPKRVDLETCSEQADLTAERNRHAEDKRAREAKLAKMMQEEPVDWDEKPVEPYARQRTFSEQDLIDMDNDNYDYTDGPDDDYDEEQ